MEKKDVVEADLEDISKDLRPGAEALSKYFVHIPAGRPGTKEAAGFKMLMYGVPTTVRTACERVTVIINDSRSIPWASVEMKTGFFYTTIEISSAELQKIPCLKETKRH